MPEYYCVQKAVTVVRFSKEVKRPAILASIAEDDGTAFQYPAFICGQGEVRLFFRTDAGAGNYIGKGFPFFSFPMWSVLRLGHPRQCPPFGEKSCPLNANRSTFLERPVFRMCRAWSKSGRIPISREKTFMVPAGKGPAPFPYCREPLPRFPACRPRLPQQRQALRISLRNQMVQHVFPAFRFNDVKKSRCRSSQRRNRPALALRAVLLKNRGIFMERTRRSSKSEPGLPCVPQVHGARFRQAA